MSLPIPDLAYGHSGAQIEKICRDRGIHLRKFWKVFGRNTCTIDEVGRINYYTKDIERTLYQLGHEDGVNHAWD